MTVRLSDPSLPRRILLNPDLGIGEGYMEGTLTIGGVRSEHLPPGQRGVAMVFQNYALYPHMSVFQNMAFGLKIAGTPKAEIAERVAHAARLLQLEGLLDRRPRELSGGQRQRVAMGRAIVRKPAVFLFDEPLSNLDAKLRASARDELKQFQERVGTTTIYVTHDQAEAMALAHVCALSPMGVGRRSGMALARCSVIGARGDPRQAPRRARACQYASPVRHPIEMLRAGRPRQTGPKAGEVLRRELREKR